MGARALQTAIKPRHDDELRAELDILHTKYGYDSVRYVTREEVRSIVATERYISALYDTNCGHLHPLNYTLGSGGCGGAAGTRIFEDTRALENR